MEQRDATNKRFVAAHACFVHKARKFQKCSRQSTDILWFCLPLITVAAVKSRDF